MLSIWWEVEGVIHYETRSNGCTIAADLCCQQLTEWHKNSMDSRIEFTTYMTTRDLMLQSRPAKNY